jgi:hypothetical protein
MKAKEVGNTAIDTANFILTSPPTLSRFLQEDPIGYEDQTNLYLYVRSNPLRYTDPSGMKTKEVLNRVVA